MKSCRRARESSALGDSAKSTGEPLVGGSSGGPVPSVPAPTGPRPTGLAGLCDDGAERCRRSPVADRLSPLDVSFLYMETPTTPMHVGGVATFRPPAEGFDHDRLVELISRRIALVPRYRQKV